MTIWLFAIIMLLSLAGLGLRQGAIRVAFSLVGILLGGALAFPLARLVKPLVAMFGVKDPLWLYLIPPVLVFLVFLVLLKVAGHTVHHKVETYYKYNAGELRIALWERIMARLGLCLGLVNALAYMVLVLSVINPFTYWTYQLSSAEGDSWKLRLLNRLGQDLQNTGMGRVAATLDRMPAVFYDLADFGGLLYQNPLREARLSRYPGFLSLAERPELLDLARDNQFTELRLKNSPVEEILDYPKIQSIRANLDLLNIIQTTVVTDLADLNQFMRTGKSPKYDIEPILGRWEFDVNGTIRAYRRDHPKVSSKDMQAFKQSMAIVFAKTTCVAGPDHQVSVKNFPRPGGGVGDVQTIPGTWSGSAGNYILSLSPGGDCKTEVDNSRMSLPLNGQVFAFSKEE